MELRYIVAAALLAALPVTAAAQVKPVKIGVLNDMSGPYRDVSGPTSAACVRQAVEEFGDRSGPGGWRVEVLAADHQNKPDLGASIARQWLDRDGVDLIEFLAEHAPPGADENYGSGHAQATGGALRPADWNAFIAGLGFGPEEQVSGQVQAA